MFQSWVGRSSFHHLREISGSQTCRKKSLMISAVGEPTTLPDQLQTHKEVSFLLTKPAAANILSAFQAGLFFGALASYLSAERFGRKRSLCGFLVIFMVGAALMTGSRGSLGLLIAGRVVAGLGIGTAAPVIPM